MEVSMTGIIPSGNEELLLVKRAKQGDKNAFCNLIRDYKSSMYGVAKTILKEEEDIKDALSSSILKAYEGIGTLRNDEYFKTWLIKIVINQCYEICRKNSRITFLDKNQKVNEERYVDTYEDLDLKRALDSLEEELKIIVELYYYEDLSLKDMAKILEVPQGTLKSRLSRARKRLYSILKED